MAVTASKFAELVERVAPLSCAYDWDNSGMTLRQHDKIEKVFLSLDINRRALDEALAQQCDTILSHHPLLFAAQKKFDRISPVEDLFLQAVHANLNLYAAHTSFDCAPGGMNDLLARQMGLKRIRPLMVLETSAGRISRVMGAIGEYEEALEPEKFAEKLKRDFGLPYVKMSRGRGAIQKVACVGGAGSEFLPQAALEGADAFVTGEVKHNCFAEAQVLGIALVEAGHYDTEKIFISGMREGLQKAQNELECNIEVICPRGQARPYEFC